MESIDLLPPPAPLKRKASIVVRRGRTHIPFLPIGVLVILAVHLYLLELHFKYSSCRTRRMIRSETTPYYNHAAVNVTTTAVAQEIQDNMLFSGDDVGESSPPVVAVGPAPASEVTSTAHAEQITSTS